MASLTVQSDLGQRPQCRRVRNGRFRVRNRESGHLAGRPTVPGDSRHSRGRAGMATTRARAVADERQLSRYKALRTGHSASDPSWVSRREKLTDRTWGHKAGCCMTGKGRFCGVFEPRYQRKLWRWGKGFNESLLHASPTSGYESGDFEQLVGGYFLGRDVVTYGRHD